MQRGRARAGVLDLRPEPRWHAVRAQPAACHRRLPGHLHRAVVRSGAVPQRNWPRRPGALARRLEQGVRILNREPLTLSLSKGVDPALRKRPSTSSGRAEMGQIFSTTPYARLLALEPQRDIARFG